MVTRPGRRGDRSYEVIPSALTVWLCTCGHKIVTSPKTASIEVDLIRYGEASSTLMPRYRTALSISVSPSRASWFADFQCADNDNAGDRVRHI